MFPVRQPSARIWMRWQKMLITSPESAVPISPCSRMKPCSRFIVMSMFCSSMGATSTTSISPAALSRSCWVTLVSPTRLPSSWSWYWVKTPLVLARKSCSCCSVACNPGSAR